MIQHRDVPEVISSRAYLVTMPTCESQLVRKCRREGLTEGKCVEREVGKNSPRGTCL